MKRSGDPRQAGTGRVIGRSGDRKQNLTTEARRHGEESGKRIIRLSEIPTPVILTEQESRIAGRRRVEGPRGCVTNKGRVREFSRECLYAVSRCEAFSGFLRLTSQDRLFDSAPISCVTESQSTRSVQDDSGRGDRLRKHSLRTPGALRRVANHARDICQLLLTTLREIFDENAYERFLRRGQISRSGASYRAFLLEREEGIARKPRCC
jgi:hypothetical protein